ncbi:hypothetical protein JTE90_012767 [Oedothorax gibbosus]|uniref:U3 small nucleolar RNA-associated protein 15 homolog n=1 Tax=Oedothorax gibbosus TaxID=931172 RepID=A0AAV6W028_9ARAC|nr:hypothetical protein JTE90_012767 [Oedothorax gibbosus]
MTDFKSLEIYKFPRPDAQITEDNLYWKNFAFPCAFKEYGAIDCVDYSPEAPHHVAVTCSAKVQIYDTSNSTQLCSMSRFKKQAYGGVFRKDGKLLVAGSEDGFLRLFEVEGHRQLRVFKGHKAATHRCRFTSDGIHLLSFSDDKTVGLWDIPTETRLMTYDEHKDYIRAGAVSQSSQDLFISGSYDHTVKMYDTRTNKSVFTMDHGTPVEAVLQFPVGGLFISAGGMSLKVWDPVAGRLLAEVQQHHKTITSLCFASNGRRIMSGSLDRHVKIYDVMTYDVVHTLNYDSPILSVGAAPDDMSIGIGMTDGIFSLQHKKPEKTHKEVKPKNKRFRHYHSYSTDFKPANDDVVVSERKKKISTKYEKHLKKFESSKALDVVLRERVQMNSPEVTVSLMMELIRRGSIRAAMAAREGESLALLIKFIEKYIGDPRFQRVLMDVAFILLELYGPKLGDPQLLKRFQKLGQIIENQHATMKQQLEISGVIQGILAAKYSMTQDTSPDEIFA